MLSSLLQKKNSVQLMRKSSLDYQMSSDNTKIPNTGEVADWWATEGVIELNFGQN